MFSRHYRLDYIIQSGNETRRGGGGHMPNK